MSEPAVKWKDALRYFKRNGFEIHTKGGDKIIVHNGCAHRIGHNFCNQASSHLSPAHLLALHRKFNITRQDILGD